eukprot:CAMPEP_0171529440 /NCGR_PEP_ID=MMETSP0959-20130129/12356_1 /TAXON_ID=87120 /ORGANISM="Aurantiochytrium limacinum, Strain ATCCMYA-1381" /LENGTH=443 /DNA_ID=CAMNT_0012071787 /DNA_START=41 /DNA_END=1368 /DNA_ORIENTATION=+
MGEDASTRLGRLELVGAAEAAKVGDPSACKALEVGLEVEEEVRSESHARVAQECQRLGVVHRFYRVPDDYYARGLDERASLLHASQGRAQLCKSVLLKNVAWDESAYQGPENAEYFLVIVQYIAKLDDDGLWRAIRSLIPEDSRPPKNKYSFRHATPEEANEICGFEHNAIAPVGLKQISKATIVVARAVTEVPVIFLGGGEVDLKLQVNTKQFIEATGALVVKCSVPRSSEDLATLTEDSDNTANSEDSSGATTSSGLASLSEEIETAFALLDLRVGHIVDAARHPESDKLLIEKIDVGDAGDNAEPRQILSGIAKYYSPEEIVGRKVVVVCNLKPAKLGGIPSAGMVMCSKSKDVDALKFVEVSQDAEVGARIGLLSRAAPGEPASAAQMKKKKILEQVLPHLFTDQNMCATTAGVPWIVLGKEEDACCTSEGITLPATVA